jgi:hypothetical protein
MCFAHRQVNKDISRKAVRNERRRMISIKPLADMHNGYVARNDDAIREMKNGVNATKAQYCLLGNLVTW